MTWTPSPADDVPNPAGINSLRKMLGFDLSKSVKSKRQSKGEETSQQSHEQQLQQQELKEEHAEEGQEEVEIGALELSAEVPGDCCPRG